MSRDRSRHGASVTVSQVRALLVERAQAEFGVLEARTDTAE